MGFIVLILGVFAWFAIMIVMAEAKRRDSLASYECAHNDPHIREYVHDTHGGRCYHCGEEMPLHLGECDHVETRKNGGEDVLGNYGWSCGTYSDNKCNQRKGGKNDWEFHDDAAKYMAAKARRARALTIGSGDLLVDFDIYGRPIRR